CARSAHSTWLPLPRFRGRYGRAYSIRAQRTLRLRKHNRGLGRFPALVSQPPAIPPANAGQNHTATGAWPKISLVTPVFNSVGYLEARIRSVLSQQYPNLEYVIVDGGSTDGSVEIIRKYEPQLHAWVSEPDRGMYNAINKGFARSSGALMGWISATDLLHAGSLFVVGGVFPTLPRVERAHRPPHR